MSGLAQKEISMGKEKIIFSFFSFLYDGEALHAASHTADALKRA